MGIGLNVIAPGTGTPVAVSSDGRPEYRSIGMTIDWSTVAAVSGSDLTTTPEGLLVKVGQKWLRFGQVMAQITTANAFTLTVSGTPTGGSILVTGYRPDTGFANTVTLTYNSSVAATQALMDSIYGTGNTVVSGAGALPGNVQTVTAAGLLANSILPLPVVGTNSLTGGTNPALAIANSAGSTAGMFGPYDTAASDGRQTLANGRCCILNQTILQNGPFGTFTTLNTDQVGGGIVGGRVWASRLIATTGTHSLANGPTFTELLAALPRLMLDY